MNIHEEMVRGNETMTRMVENLQANTLSFLQVTNKVADNMSQGKHNES